MFKKVQDFLLFWSLQMLTGGRVSVMVRLAQEAQQAEQEKQEFARNDYH